MDTKRNHSLLAACVSGPKIEPYIGKWHMGGHHDDPRPGFDYWVSFKGQGNYFPPNPNYTINVNGKRVPQDGYITTLLTDYAIDFLEQQTERDKPFFLYLSHKAVHSNFTPEDRYKGRFDGKEFDQLELLFDNKLLASSLHSAFVSV